MTNKFIKKLALASYTKGNLDKKKVEKIIKYLTKIELKSYIKLLKNLEKQKIVYVFLPKLIGKIQSNEIRKLFPNKKVRFVEDKSLIAGIKIVDNDIVFEQNLKNNLNNLVNYLEN